MLTPGVYVDKIPGPTIDYSPTGLKRPFYLAKTDSEVKINTTVTITRKKIPKNKKTKVTTNPITNLR